MTLEGTYQDAVRDIPDSLEPLKVTIPYIPRVHFIGLHASTKRFKFVVAHRRAGKSVAEINETIKKALQNKRVFPHPRYGYVGPSFAQTKDLIWGYLKHYISGIPGCKISEGDLEVTLPNGATITLYGGAAAWERMRGIYFDGIVLDEFPLLNPAVLSTVVRPCLADYRGWAIVSGTSNGDDHFHELKKKADKDPSWDVFIIPVNKTDALHPDEVQEMTKDMTPEEFAREMMCAFDAPIEGAYYADKINELTLMGRVTGVPHDPAAKCFTWWDLGIDDMMAIWILQRVGRELHVIDYYENSGKGLEHYANVLKGNADYQPEQHRHRRAYVYATHVLPHDIKARELGTGRSRFEVLSELLDDVFVCPMHRVEDGITAARSVLSLCYFDAERCKDGLSALRNYHRSKAGKPVHNWASHGADAFRTGSVAFDQTMSYVGAGNITSMSGALRRRRRGRV